MTKSTKIELCNRSREIRDSYKNGEVVSKKDQNWLIENVFKYHPNWNWLYNQGIKYFTVNHDGYKSRCFYVHFNNPEHYSSANISWNKAIRNIH